MADNSAPPSAVPTPEQAPTLPLWPDTARALGLSRSAVYEQAASGRLPVEVIRCGRKLRVPTAALRRALCLD